jgi:hypothetical protein
MGRITPSLRLLIEAIQKEHYKTGEIEDIQNALR